MTYVDGFVLPVKKADREIYRAYAAQFTPIFKEFGALAVMECFADDVPHGKQTDFYMAVKCEADETVVFSWIVWPDKAARDAGNAKIMEDPRMQKAMVDPPFDAKRMIYGGFDTIVSA
jgi:uncharacterized protein YbaA (DUF1428 family)